MYHLVEALAVWPDADDMRQSPIYHFINPGITDFILLLLKDCAATIFNH